MADGDFLFAGSIPELYDRRMVPLIFDVYAQDLASRLPVSGPMRVLEIACGTGVVTGYLRERLPDGSTLVATDLNEPMLDICRKKFAEVDGIEWRQVDAMALPFPDGSFDAVVCQFGLMFFPDKGHALREMRRVLSNDGSLLLNVWDDISLNDPPRILQKTLARIFADNPPTFLGIPYGMSDQAALRALIENAGFTVTELVSIQKTTVTSSAADAAEGFIQGTPVVNWIRENHPSRLEEATRETALALADACGASPITAEIQAIVVTASPNPPLA